MVRRLLLPIVVLTLLAVTLVAMDGSRHLSGPEVAAIAGILGGLLTLAIGALLRLIARRERVADGLADERTAELAESEQRFRLLADNSTDWITRHRPDGTWAYVSPACRELLGYEPEELVGRSPYEFVHPRDRPRLRWTNHAQLDGPEVHTVAYRFRAKDGSWIWFETKSRGITDSDTAELVEVQCATRDISERVRVEKKLRRQGRFLETVLDSLGAGVIACDPAGNVTLANRATREIRGMDPDGDVAADWLKHEVVYDPDGRVLGRHELPLIRALEGEEVNDRELVMVLPDGDARAVLANSRPITGEDGELLGAVTAMQDITDRLHAEEEVRASERRFRALAENAPVGIYETDPRGGRRFVNETWVEIAGISAVDATGGAWLRAVHPDDRDAVRAEWELASRLGREFNAEFRFLHPDGRVVWAWSKAHRLSGPQGETTGYIGTCIDITERKDHEGRLRHPADHDALTGLLNRRRFEEELERELSSAARYGTGGALLALDVDDFKHVNDSLGHAVGDEVLRRVGELLRGRLRKSDVIARLGGDEFAVILPQVDEAQARAVADGLLQAARTDADLRVGDHERRISFSIGIAMFDHDEQPTADGLLVEADVALYDAKEAGRDRAAPYDGARHSQESMHARLTLADRIREALDTDGFVLHAQPIVGLVGDPTPRYELLIRMKGENGDVIPPGKFLYIAERFELIQRIDRWVVSRAVALLAEEQGAGRDVRFEVNLSAKSVTDPDFPGFVERALLEAEVDARGLCFEVTETATIVNVERAKVFAKRIASLGCQFALDDFGSGSASFHYLKHLDFDYLKIDGELVRDLPQSHTNQLVVRSVVDIARGLGKKTIAEFVEDDETLALLCDYGVDFAQGFGIAKPAAVEDMEFTATALPQPARVPSPTR